MKLPETSENIFPESKENYTALLEHYFPKTSDEERSHSLKQWLEEKRDYKFSLNQIEFGARLCRENEILLDICGFSSIPSARIKFTLMALFIPINQWDEATARSHRERLKNFRTMAFGQPALFKKIDSSGFANSIFPKSTENLEAIYKTYYENEGEVERLRFQEHFSESRDSLGAIHFAAQFCEENQDFLKEAGVNWETREMIHGVLKAIFYPNNNWSFKEIENDRVKYKMLKNLYLQHIKKQAALAQE